MTWLVKFPPPDKLLSMNLRLHWAERASRTRSWRDAAKYTARNMKCGTGLRGLDPSFVRVTFPVRDNRRRDADNPAPTVKAIVDGLVDAGMWPDDTPEYVETLGSRFAKGAEMVVVEIIPRKEIAA